MWTTGTAVAAILLLGGAAAGASAQELQLYSVDRASSHLYVVTGRSGLLGFLGHDHAILAREWTVEVCTEDTVPTGSRGSIVIETGSLEIDSDSALALAGIGRSPGEDDIREIQEKMLSPEYLAADEHPEIRIETTTVQPEEAGSVLAEGEVTVRGIPSEVEFPVEVERLNDEGLRLSGLITVRHTEFDMEPESIFRVVRVSDPVDLHFLLTAVPTGERCDGSR